MSMQRFAQNRVKYNITLYPALCENPLYGILGLTQDVLTWYLALPSS
jgi:hypothetical protein